MAEWIFTFGFGHEHPVTGESLARRFIRISADDEDAARIEMAARFGIKWAFQYVDEEEAGVERYNLIELEQTDAHVEVLKKRQAQIAARGPERTKVRADDRTDLHTAGYLRAGAGITIHVVHEGLALCGKPGVPGLWGPGHRWVYRDHDEGGPRSAVNCPGCAEQLTPWIRGSLDAMRVPAAVDVQRGVYVDAGGNEVPIGWDPFDGPRPTTANDHERAVLAELGRIPDHTLQSWIDRSFLTVTRLAQRELARRRFARENPAPPPIDADFPDRLTPPQRALAQYIIDISQDAYDAHWMMGIEHQLWDAVAGQRCGNIEITPVHVMRLHALSAEAGGWIVWQEDDVGEAFMPLDEWRAHHARFMAAGVLR